MFRYNFVIDYRFDNKNFANNLFRRFNFITIIKEKIENNRQMLTRLREFLQTNFDKFRICVNVIRIELFKFDKKINFANNFFDVYDYIFNEIINFI